MGAGNRKDREESRPSYEDLEEWVRLKVQAFVQDVLEEEVTEMLGRGKHQRLDIGTDTGSIGICP